MVAYAGQGVGIDFVDGVSRGMVELIRPLVEHGHGHADGGIGEDVMVGAAGEVGGGVAVKGVVAGAVDGDGFVVDEFAQAAE